MSLFATIPAYDGSESQDRIIQISQIEEIKPVAPINFVDSKHDACEIRFASGATTTVLLSFSVVSQRLQTLNGVVDEWAQTT